MISTDKSATNNTESTETLKNIETKIIKQEENKSIATKVETEATTTTSATPTTTTTVTTSTKTKQKLQKVKNQTDDSTSTNKSQQSVTVSTKTTKTSNNNSQNFVTPSTNTPTPTTTTTTLNGTSDHTGGHHSHHNNHMSHHSHQQQQQHHHHHAHHAHHNHHPQNPYLNYYPYIPQAASHRGAPSTSSVQHLDQNGGVWPQAAMAAMAMMDPVALAAYMNGTNGAVAGYLPPQPLPPNSVQPTDLMLRFREFFSGKLPPD